MKKTNDKAEPTKDES